MQSFFAVYKNVVNFHLPIPLPTAPLSPADLLSYSYVADDATFCQLFVKYVTFNMPRAFSLIKYARFDGKNKCAKNKPDKIKKPNKKKNRNKKNKKEKWKTGEKL